MKLRYQIIFLLGLPVACQLATVGLLTHSYAKVDEVAAKETVAKRIVALSEEMNGQLGQSVLKLSSKAFFQSPAIDAPDHLSLSFKQKLAELRKLVKGNSTAESIVDRYERDSRRFIDNIEDLVRSYTPGNDRLFFSQFIDNDDFAASMNLTLGQLNEETVQLLRIYSPVASEFQPEALRARADLRNSIILAITVNVLLVIALAALVNKNMLARLQVLMNNMRLFSRGAAGSQRLTGSDEFAELDQAFKEMSDQRNRLEEIRKTTQAMVSHDLRSPLNAMGLRIEMMLANDDYKLTDEAAVQLRRLGSETDRLMRLSKTLLNLEKIESGHMDVTVEPVCASEVINTSVAAVQSIADRKEIAIEVSSDGLIFEADKDQTIQVLVNLLTNALKFAPKNSTIKIVSRQEGQAVRIEVIDQGPGVPSEKVSRLFTKFSQLEQSAQTKAEGSGLGLYICKMLIGAQKGEIGYKPAPDSGSCFWFELRAGSNGGS